MPAFRASHSSQIFNLFAETFHWIVDNKLQRMRLLAKIVHYLDDFMIILSPATNVAHREVTQHREVTLSQIAQLAVMSKRISITGTLNFIRSQQKR